MSILTSQIDFSKGDGFVPAIVQDSSTYQVLMLGYMNQEAFEITTKTGLVTFFSRTKNRIWTKGEESGNSLKVVSSSLDCDNDTLLYLVEPIGPTCHKGTKTCWNEEEKTKFDVIASLEDTITDRINNKTEKSYVADLTSQGIHKVAQKVGEEAVEVVIEAMMANDTLFLEESADLLFHYLVLLQSKGFKINDVLNVLEKRAKK
jgi:phosphoribosyl-AMP cyclohydrolase / phosphoribosyl-ATP pyrophosphohydrolase